MLKHFLLALLCVCSIARTQTAYIDSIKSNLPDTRGVQRVLSLYRIAYRLSQHDARSGVSYSMQTFDLAQEIDYPLGVVKACRCLGRNYMWLSERDSALYWFDRARQISQQHHFNKELLDIEISRAAVIQRSGRQKEGLDVFKSVLPVCKDTLATYSPLILTNIAITYYCLACYDSMMIYCDRAIESGKSLGIETYLHANYGVMGEVLSTQRQYKQAVAMQRESLRYSRKQSPAAVADASNALGKTFRNMSLPDSALKYYRLALDGFTRVGNRAGRRIVFGNLGEIWLEKAVYDSARIMFKMALDLTRDEETGQRMHYTLDISRMHLEMGDLPRAFNWSRRAEAMMDTSFAPDLLLKAYDHFYRVSVRVGRYAEALEYHLRHDAVRDSMFTLEKARIMKEMQAKYEAEKKERELAELRQTAFKNRITQRIILMAVFIGFILLLHLIFSFRVKRRKLERQKRRAEKELACRNRELTSQAMHLARIRELIGELRSNVDGLVSGSAETGRNALFCVLQDLEDNVEDRDHWKEFEVRFKEIHMEFYSTLNRLYPDLSPAEIKICAFLKLNMTTKDIALLTNRSVRTIESTRLKIRKKLNLCKEANLTSHLMQI